MDFSTNGIVTVIPAYRVQDTIASVLKDLPAYIEHIIVEDDASPDSSANLVVAAAQQDSRIVQVRHEKNQGVGGAMISGFRKALELGAKIIVQLDGDWQIDPAHIPTLVTPLVLGKADYAKGNRFRDFVSLRNMPIVRRVGNLGLSFLTKAATGYWNIFDPTNGFFAIRAEVLAQLPLEAIDKRYFFGSELRVPISRRNKLHPPRNLQDTQNTLGSSVLLVRQPARTLLRRFLLMSPFRFSRKTNWNCTWVATLTSIGSSTANKDWGLLSTRAHVWCATLATDEVPFLSFELVARVCVLVPTSHFFKESALRPKRGLFKFQVLLSRFISAESTVCDRTFQELDKPTSKCVFIIPHSPIPTARRLNCVNPCFSSWVPTTKRSQVRHSCVTPGCQSVPALARHASGAVYVYVRSGVNWGAPSRLVQNDPVSGENFGYAVSVVGDLAIIGAPGYTFNPSGSAYLFARQGSFWSQDSRIIGAHLADGFGASVAISEGMLLIGSPNFRESISQNPNVGAAYLARLALFADGFED